METTEELVRMLEIAARKLAGEISKDMAPGFAS